MLMKARDPVYDDLGEGTWNLEVIKIFQALILDVHVYVHVCIVLARSLNVTLNNHIHSLSTGERSELEKSYNNRIKTTFGYPLLPIKHVETLKSMYFLLHPELYGSASHLVYRTKHRLKESLSARSRYF